MLTYMLDTNICIYVMKNYPLDLREKFNSLAEQLCISSITLGELHYGAEKSARRVDNLTAIEHFVARLDVLPFEVKAAAHYGQVRAELERAGTPCGPHDMQIGGHARSEGLIIVTNNLRGFRRMRGMRVENWVRALLPLGRRRRRVDVTLNPRRNVMAVSSDLTVKQRGGMAPHSRDMRCPRFAQLFTLRKQRAQGKPGARCTRGLACKCT